MPEHSEKRRRTEAVCVRFLPDERQKLAIAAQKRGITAAELLRIALQNELETR